MGDEDVRVRIEAEDATSQGAKQAGQTIAKEVEAAAGALDGFKSRLQAINTERERTFAAMGDQFKDLQKKLATATAAGDGVYAAKIKQDLATLARPMVEAQRSALAEMSKDVKLSDDEYMEVKRRQYQVEQELRNLDVAAHRAAEDQKVAETRRAEQQQAAEVKKAEQEKVVETRKAEQERTAALKQEAQKRQAFEQNLQGAMAAGAIAGVALAGVKKVVDESIDAFSAQQRAFAGLTAIANAYGQSASAAKQASKTLTSDGILPLGSAVAGIRDLLTGGLNIDQATKMMEVFKNRAALGRAETVSYSQAVENLAQAFKTEQSALGNLSGMTENFSQVIAVGAKQLGKKVTALSDAERAQAKYLGILALSQGYIGGAATMTETLSGAQARLTTTTIQAKAALGEALAPAAYGTTNALQKVLQLFTDWIQVNPELARGLVIAATGALGLASAVGIVAAAIFAMNLAMGPTGLLIAGIAAVAGGLGGIAVANQATKAAFDQTSVATSGLLRQYEALRKALDDNTLKTDEKARAQQKLKDVMSKLFELQPQMKTWFDTEGRLVDSQKGKYDTLRQAVLNVAEAKLRLQQIEAQKKLNDINGELSKKFGTDEDWEAIIRNMQKANVPPEVIVSATLKRRDRIRFDPEGQTLLAQRDLAKAQVEEAKAVLAELRKPLDVDPLIAPPAGGGGDGPPPSSEMSAALRAAMEDLQDLQALDKTPENLRRTLARVREILSQHGTELQKLNKDRDLIRLRDIALPKEITQAEYTDVMRKLQTDEQMAQAGGKPLDPAVIRERLQAIKAQFADYLTTNPDAGAALDVRLAGLDPEEIRQKVQKAMDAIEGKKKLMGKSYTHEDERRDLAAILPVAYALPGGESSKQIDDLIDRMRRLDEAMQRANFDRKVKAIASAWEQAQAAAEPQLAALEKQLISEEARGDKASPAVIQSMKTRMLALLTPALEAQRNALEALRDSITGDDEQAKEQRAQVERELNSVKKTLYSKDVDAHRIASDAKVAVERKAADEREKIQSKAIKALDKAERDLTEATKARHQTEEDVIEDSIRAKERELQLYERQLAAEDRLENINKAKKKVADLEKSGEREAVLTANGTWEVRIKGMEEAQDALTKAEKEDAEARRKEQLQDEVRDLRLKLDNLKEAHQKEEAEITKHFRTAKELLEDGFEKMKTAQVEQIGKMTSELSAELTKALGPWRTYASEVQKLLAGIAAPAAPGEKAATKNASEKSVVGDVAKAIIGGMSAAEAAAKFGLTGMIDGKSYNVGKLTAPTVPTLPTLPTTAGTATSGVGVSIGDVTVKVSIDGATAQSPQAIGAAVASGTQNGLAAFARGAARGRI